MESFLTVEEFAHNIKVQEGTVRKWLREGKLRALKLDRVWRIPESEVEAHLTGGNSGGEPFKPLSL